MLFPPSCPLAAWAMLPGYCHKDRLLLQAGWVGERGLRLPWGSIARL